jgi:hypothetical protein
MQRLAEFYKGERSTNLQFGNLGSLYTRSQSPRPHPQGQLLKDNWLIVTHPQLLEDQREHEKKRGGLARFIFHQYRSGKKGGSFSKNYLVYFALQLRLGDPGPLTLFSLEQGLVEKDRVYIYSLRLQKQLGKVNKVLRLRKEHGEVQPMEVRAREMV